MKDGAVGSEGIGELNRDCFCTSLDRGALAEALSRETPVDGFAARLLETHPTLFSSVSVFIPQATLDAMMQIVTAIEDAAQLPAYRTAALARAPAVATHDFGPVGVFMGYDFHVTANGPRLIEINTNAGGAFLNAPLARAQRECCDETVFLPVDESARHFDDNVMKMFLGEWRLQRGSGAPSRIAIVDDAPERQHLYPEFQLAKALLERHGFETVIIDACDLIVEAETLTVGGHPIDLVYNRLVDFSLEQSQHNALRTAYAEGLAVITPNPHVHALFADKRNLAVLSDSDLLRASGLGAAALEALQNGIPKTLIVSPERADDLWRTRNRFFFKPAGGHGGKAAYRGDKLTRKVWAEILCGDYVAQEFVRPSLRRVMRDGERTDLKYDIRLYTYAGSPVLAAARLYQGQTTNMRTPGGGFAPVHVMTGPQSSPACAD
jgi:hypothetical protein